ncbi:MAG: demethylmenaquinone methyltransferase [Corynebacteriales bacterium]|nr:demethylmenaquinone methyltransferase [Mycobacteriales bacterium]
MQQAERPSLEKEPTRVSAMFDRVASRYDITNTLLSFGMDASWRRATRRALDLQPGEYCLDLAAGTAVSTVELSRSGATVIGCDFSLGMLKQGLGHGVPLTAGDALALPFRDNSFDAATISFGLRNVADVPLALSELRRVTKPGGRLVVCEFSTPKLAPMRWGHRIYLRHGMPTVARLVSSDNTAYGYLADSIQDWPDQRALAEKLAQAGWEDVQWRNLFGGVVALHRASLPK